MKLMDSCNAVDALTILDTKILALIEDVEARFSEVEDEANDWRKFFFNFIDPKTPLFDEPTTVCSVGRKADPELRLSAEQLELTEHIANIHAVGHLLKWSYISALRSSHPSLRASDEVTFCATGRRWSVVLKKGQAAPPLFIGGFAVHLAPKSSAMYVSCMIAPGGYRHWQIEAGFDVLPSDEDLEQLRCTVPCGSIGVRIMLAGYIDIIYPSGWSADAALVTAKRHYIMTTFQRRWYEGASKSFPFRFTCTTKGSQKTIAHDRVSRNPVLKQNPSWWQALRHRPSRSSGYDLKLISHNVRAIGVPEAESLYSQKSACSSTEKLRADAQEACSSISSADSMHDLPLVDAKLTELSAVDNLSSPASWKPSITVDELWATTATQRCYISHSSVHDDEFRYEEEALITGFQATWSSTGENIQRSFLWRTEPAPNAAQQGSKLRRSGGMIHVGRVSGSEMPRILMRHDFDARIYKPRGFLESVKRIFADDGTTTVSGGFFSSIGQF